MIGSVNKISTTPTKNIGPSSSQPHGVQQPVVNKTKTTIFDDHSWNKEAEARGPGATIPAGSNAPTGSILTTNLVCSEGGYTAAVCSSYTYSAGSTATVSCSVQLTVRLDKLFQVVDGALTVVVVETPNHQAAQSIHILQTQLRAPVQTAPVGQTVAIAPAEKPLINQAVSSAPAQALGWKPAWGAGIGAGAAFTGVNAAGLLPALSPDLQLAICAGIVTLVGVSARLIFTLADKNPASSSSTNTKVVTKAH
jgi:hypothetical protein